MDVNNDGVLSRKEIVRFVRLFLGNPMDAVKNTVNDIWDEYDTNNSGVLEKDQARLFVKQTLTEFVGADMIGEIW